MASHSSFSDLHDRLPAHLLALYLGYKKSTGTIIEWLQRHGKAKDKRSNILSIADLKRLSIVASKKRKSAPEHIRGAFQSTIVAREKITHHFKQIYPSSDSATIKHEYFTNSLIEIFETLFPKSSQVKCTAPSSQVFEDKSTDLCGYFGRLELEDPAETGQEEPAHQTSRAASNVSDDAAAIKGDLMAQVFELPKALRDIENLHQAVTEAWEDVGEGTIPAVLGSFVTNTALAAITPIAQRLGDFDDELTPDTFNNNLKKVQDAGNHPRMPNNSLGPSRSSLSDMLQLSWTVLKACRSEYTNLGETNATQSGEKPTDYFTQKDQSANDKVQDAMTRIVQNIVCLALDNRTALFLHELASPLTTNIRKFCLEENRSADALELSFGLLLLYDSYRSFIHTFPITVNPPNCRLNALQFAQEVVPCITEILKDPNMLCRCQDCLGRHFQAWKDELNKFTSEKSFTLNSQSPWICGSQTLSMLFVVSSFGSKLLTHGQYVGTIIHCYSILSQFNRFQSIPILETLIDAFEKKMIPGGLPRSNFHACALRYCGARPHVNRAANHKNGSHNMIIPERQRATDGSGVLVEANASRFEFYKSTLFLGTIARNYSFSEGRWANNDELAKEALSPLRKENFPPDTPTDNPIYKLATRYQDYISAPSHRIQRLLQLILIGEFGQGSVMLGIGMAPPEAKLNFLKIYMACVKVVDIMSDFQHPYDKGLRCPCFLKVLAEAADRYDTCAMTKKTKKAFEENELMNELGWAMEEVFKGTTVEDFLWQNLI